MSRINCICRSASRIPRRGFTLVELLVVVVIVVVVIGLSLPALSSAREAARAAVCQSNLRGLGAAVASYALSNKDLLPMATKYPDLHEGRIAPFDILAAEIGVNSPSLRDGLVHTGPPFLCPSDREYGHRVGTSYRYVPADFMGIPYIWGSRPQYFVTRMYEDGPTDFLLIADVKRFHGRTDHRSSTQAIFYSQVVRRLQ